MSSDRLITVRKSFCSDVTFSLDLGALSVGKTHESRVKRVLQEWRNITGLSWDLMPSETGADNEHEWALVSNPMDNQSKVQFYWNVLT